MIAVRAVVPITLIILLGVITKNRKVLSDRTFKDMTWIVFHYCLPLTLFMNIMNADLGAAADPKLILFALGMLSVVVLLTMLALRRSQMKDTRKGVIVQAMYRSNFAILGLPIVENIYGSANTGATSVLIAFVLPFFNIVSVLILQKYSGGKGDLKQTIRNLLHNPMILGAIAGFIWKLLGIPFPAFGGELIQSFTKMTTPLSLFALGGSFNMRSLKANGKLLALFDLINMIIMPVCVLGLAVLIGYRGVELVSLLVLFAGPTAIASYAMSAEMGMDSELAAQIIVVTTLTVAVTVFLFIYFFGVFGLL